MIVLDRIKILVVEQEGEERASILEALANVDYVSIVGDTEDAEAAMGMLEYSDPDVVLIGAEVAEDGYSLAERIAAEFPSMVMIMMERQLKEETMRKVIFAGAKDVLVYPIVPSKLIDSVYRSFQMENRKKALQKQKTPRAQRRGKQGQVITVFSTKGGVGKTFISTNLAVALAKSTNERVVLVDLDLDFGNAALALNLTTRFTIADVVDEIRNLDQDLMESYLTPHESGAMILPANAQPQLSEYVRPEHVELILKTLQSAFDYVVVDTPARFYEPVTPAFQMADTLFLVTTPEISTVRNIKSSLMTLNDLNYPKAKIKILLNRADQRGEIKAKDVEATLGHSLFGIITAEYRLVTSSLNKGTPVVMLNPRAGISKNIWDLAKKISDNHRA